MDTSLSQSGHDEATERLFLRGNRSPTVEGGPSNATRSLGRLLHGHRGTSSPSESTQPRRRRYRYLVPRSETAGTLQLLLLKHFQGVTWGTPKKRLLRGGQPGLRRPPVPPGSALPPPPSAEGSLQRPPALPAPGCRHPSHTAPRHLRPRHLLAVSDTAPGGGAGLLSGGTIPHSPSEEGESPPGGGPQSVPGLTRDPPALRGGGKGSPPPPGRGGRPAAAVPLSGHLGAVPQRRPFLLYLPLHASSRGSPPPRGEKPRPPPARAGFSTRPLRALSAREVPGRSTPPGRPPPAATPLFGRKRHPPPLSPPVSPGLKLPLPPFSHPVARGEERRGGRVFPGWGPFNNRSTTKTTRQRSRTPSGFPGPSPGGGSASCGTCRLRGLPAGPAAQGTPGVTGPAAGSPASSRASSPLPGGDRDACAAELGLALEEGIAFCSSSLLPPWASSCPPREPRTPFLSPHPPEVFWAVPRRSGPTLPPHGLGWWQGPQLCAAPNQLAKGSDMARQICSRDGLCCRKELCETWVQRVLSHHGLIKCAKDKSTRRKKVT